MATVVGPAAPKKTKRKVRKREKDRTPEEKAWESARDMLVGLAKRWKVEQDPVRVELKKVEAKREKIAKLQDTKPRRAPATPPDQNGRYQQDETYQAFDLVTHHIEPPFRLDILCRLLEDSSCLRPNIDAMATNIDGFGHRFVPILEFSKPEIFEKIRDLMVLEKIKEAEIDDLMDELDEAKLEELEPSEEEVLKRKEFWEKLARIEKGRVEALFKFINPLESFTSIRRKTREALELMGNASWEIIREDEEDAGSKIEQVHYVPFVNVRLLPKDNKPTMTTMRVRCDAVRFQEIPVERYFRRFVRITGQSTTYYKEFGDPRFVSRDSGSVYKSVSELRAEEGENARLATEILHWKIDSQISPYGVPRWIGSLLSVLGSRASEEVNFIYFDNKAIPPMIMMVSGGRLTDESVHKIEGYIEDKIKGRENYHKIMVIEGLPADADVSEGDIEHSGKLRIELKPLLDAQISDALFQEYDKNNQLKVGRSFRQPQLLTGQTKDMNRSTAEVAKAFSEEQIYQPKRTDFDEDIDRFFMVNLKVHFWRFKTNAPVQRIPNDLINNTKKGLDSGGLTPNEARELFGDAFSTEFEYIDEPWGNVPPKLALQAARTGSFTGGEPVAGPEEETRSLEDEPEVVASGTTIENSDHDHRFMAIKSGDKLVVSIFETSGHVHSTQRIKYEPGKPVSLEITEKGDGAHTHRIKFVPALTRKQVRAASILNTLSMLRGAVKEGIEEAKDEFFDASRWVDEE